MKLRISSHEITLDDEFAELVNDLDIKVTQRNKTFRVTAKTADGKEDLHRILFGDHRPLIVHYKNGDALDLRRENIEYITRKEQYKKNYIIQKRNDLIIPTDEMIYLTLLGFGMFYGRFPTATEGQRLFDARLYDYLIQKFGAWYDILEAASEYEEENPMTEKKMKTSVWLSEPLKKVKDNYKSFSGRLSDVAERYDALIKLTEVPETTEVEDLLLSEVFHGSYLTAEKLSGAALDVLECEQATEAERQALSEKVASWTAAELLAYAESKGM